MKMTEALYITPGEYLQQGDIFGLPLVTPYADSRQRLFRTPDGRHGSFAFTDGESGRIFDPEDLKEAVGRVSKRTEFHTDPFEPTPLGESELVVTYADLTPLFVLMTQTCDISGRDKTTVKHGLIAPATPMARICQSYKLNVPDEAGGFSRETVESHLANAGITISVTGRSSDALYMKELRRLIEEWKPRKGTVEKQIRGAFLKFINQYGEKAYLHHMVGSEEPPVPEMVIDFSRLYTVPTASLKKIRELRIATIARAHRDSLARSFGNWISRIATEGGSAPPRIT